MITFYDNPRVDIEKRIKQLDMRIAFLLKYRGMGSIDYENGEAVRFYPSLMPKEKRDQAGRLLDICRKESDMKWKQLKSF